MLQETKIQSVGEFACQCITSMVLRGIRSVNATLVNPTTFAVWEAIMT